MLAIVIMTAHANLNQHTLNILIHVHMYILYCSKHSALVWIMFKLIFLYLGYVALCSVN